MIALNLQTKTAPRKNSIDLGSLSFLSREDETLSDAGYHSCCEYRDFSTSSEFLSLSSFTEKWHLILSEKSFAASLGVDGRV